MPSKSTLSFFLFITFSRFLKQVFTPLKEGGLTFARVRFTTYAGLSHEGLAWDGEVEDYGVYISETDYGDAPEPYPTLFSDNGQPFI